MIPLDREQDTKTKYWTHTIRSREISREVALMNHNFEFDKVTQRLDYARLSSTAGGCVAATRRELTAEDVLYRVATVSAVVLLLITML